MRHELTWVPPAGEPWTPPWRCEKQAACRGESCHLRAPRLCMAVVLVDGLCPTCTRKAGKLGGEAVVARPEQLELPW